MKKATKVYILPENDDLYLSARFYTALRKITKYYEATILITEAEYEVTAPELYFRAIEVILSDFV